MIYIIILTLSYIFYSYSAEFCNELFKDLQRTQWTRLLWRQVKPMIRGKLLYTPDNPAVRMIVKEVCIFSSGVCLHQRLMLYYNYTQPLWLMDK